MANRSGGSFTLLAVCTGNICRSPAIERFFRTALGTSNGVFTHSAGTGALVGQPIQPPMVALLEAHSIHASDFAARQISDKLIVESNLILTATRKHRGHVVDQMPAAVRRTFTLREFARLASRVDSEQLATAAGPCATSAARLAALVPLASMQRSHVNPDLDNIVDPYGQSDEIYEDSYEQITEAASIIVRVIMSHTGP